MPDPNPNPNPNPNPKPGEGDPNPNPNPAPTAFDPAKVGDEDFAKIFDDPRTWNHPRFKELTDASKKLKKFEDDQKKANEAKLLEEKKHEELAALREKERDEWRGKYTNSLVDNAIMAEAAKKGVTDLDAAKKLIDRTNIKVNEDGTIAGVTEAVDALVKEKTYLVGGKKGGVGQGTNPANPGANEGKFTISQIQDPVFYAKNHDAIKLAMARGEIVDDRT